MKRGFLLLLVLPVLAACAQAPAAALITTAAADGSEVGGERTIGCLLMGPTGTLVVDPVYGTVLRTERAAYTTPGPSPAPRPVAWPEGYTARWAGSELEVLGPSGDVVATTGRRYEIMPSVDTYSSLPDVYEGFVAVGGCIQPR